MGRGDTKELAFAGLAMGHPRFRVIDLVLLVMASAIGTHVWREYNYSFGEDLVFATYLGLLSTAALGLWTRGVAPRPFFAGYAAFAMLYLVLGLWFGFVAGFGAKCEIGMGYGFMAGVAARWVMAGGPLGPRTRSTPGDSA
jgi:hypothetical protein